MKGHLARKKGGWILCLGALIILLLLCGNKVWLFSGLQNQDTTKQKQPGIPLCVTSHSCAGQDPASSDCARSAILVTSLERASINIALWESSECHMLWAQVHSQQHQVVETLVRICTRNLSYCNGYAGYGTNSGMIMSTETLPLAQACGFSSGPPICTRYIVAWSAVQPQHPVRTQ